MSVFDEVVASVVAAVEVYVAVVVVEVFAVVAVMVSVVVEWEVFGVVAVVVVLGDVHHGGGVLVLVAIFFLGAPAGNCSPFLFLHVSGTILVLYLSGSDYHFSFYIVCWKPQIPCCELLLLRSLWF